LEEDALFGLQRKQKIFIGKVFLRSIWGRFELARGFQLMGMKKKKEVS